MRNVILTYVNQYHFILREQHLRLCKNCIRKPFRHRVNVRLKNGNSFTTEYIIYINCCTEKKPYYGTLPMRQVAFF